MFIVVLAPAPLPRGPARGTHLPHAAVWRDGRRTAAGRTSDAIVRRRRGTGGRGDFPGEYEDMNDRRRKRWLAPAVIRKTRARLSAVSRGGEDVVLRSARRIRMAVC